MSTWHIPAPSGGVDVTLPPHRIRDDRLSEAVNLWFRDGALRTRPAVTETATLPACKRWQTFSLGRRVLLHGETGGTHVLAVVEADGRVRHSTHTLSGVTDLLAVPWGYEDKRSVLIFVHSILIPVCGCYELTEDGTLNKLTPTVPTVLSAARPTATCLRADTGARLEPLNLLQPQFTCRYTADGTGLYYWVPADITPDMTAPFSVAYTDMTGGTLTHTVTVRGEDGLWKEEFPTVEDIPVDGLMLQYDPSQGCFWFVHAHGGGVAPLSATEANNVTLTASRTTDPDGILRMRFGTWFGGTADGLLGGVRLFLGGHPQAGHRIHWSVSGDPLFFPEHNYAFVGDAASAVTAFGKQGDSLVLFKEHEIYATTDRGGSVTAEQLLSGEVTDTEAVNTFPISLIHPERGCDRPQTLCLCGDRLVWLCGDGGVYTLVSGGAFDPRSVRKLSAPIESALRSLPEAASAAVYDGHYLLWLDGTAWVLNGDTPDKEIWHRFDLPLSSAVAVSALSQAVFVTIGDTATAVHTFTEAAADTVGGRTLPITARLCTKWYPLGDEGRHKYLSRLQLWLTGDDGGRVTVTLEGRQAAIVRLTGEPIEQAPPRRVPLCRPQVRYASVGLHVSGRVVLDALAVTYRRMGEITE